MTTDGFHYAVELFNEAGTSLGQAPVEVDFEPARESGRLDAIRQDRLSPDELAPAHVLPRWEADLGQPYLSGFEVRVCLEGGGEIRSEFSTAYFAELAQSESARLVEGGRLVARERFSYRVTAFPTCSPQVAETERRFAAEETAAGVPLKEGDLASFLERSDPHQIAAEEDLPVFVPQEVLEEATDLARRSPGLETGGILVGHLQRDSTVPEAFALVTAQIPATYTEAHATSLTFTARTWAEAQSVLTLRRKDERMLGWWHSHVIEALCKGCPLERRRVCPLADRFFSGADRALHRAVFPGAHQVALVVNLLDAQNTTHSFFGWRGGRLESRGVHTLAAALENPKTSALQLASYPGGKHHDASA